MITIEETDILNLIGACRNEPNIDIQIQILHQINEMLPQPLHVNLPSLLTNDYIVRALDLIEDTIRYNEGSQFFIVFESNQSR